MDVTSTLFTNTPSNFHLCRIEPHLLQTQTWRIYIRDFDWELQASIILIFRVGLQGEQIAWTPYWFVP